MAKTVIVLNTEGVRALLLSSEVSSMIDGMVRARAAGLGDGYEVSTKPGRNRVSGRIEAVSAGAYADNLESNTLVKAVSS